MVVKEKSPIPAVEYVAYFGIWSSSILYMIFRVYQTSQYFIVPDDKLVTYDFLLESWLIPNKNKDYGDYDWSSFSVYYKMEVPYLALHVIGSEVIKQFNQNKILRSFRIGIALLFFVRNYSLAIVLKFAIQPLLFYLITLKCKSLKSIWVYAVLQHIVIMCTNSKLESFYSYYIILVTFSWSTLRCLSYCWDKVSFKSDLNILEIYSYIYYLPLMTAGPVVIYRDFRACETNNHSGFLTRLFDFTKTFLRLAFWYFAFELMLHYIYPFSLNINVEFVSKLEPWARYGLGYYLGVLFHVKYVVLYGISCAIAKFEGVTVPSQPKCICRIHLYSEMWRFFDVGLYNFLKHYIYLPTQTASVKLNKYLARIIVFCFIYVWHGASFTMFVWSALNLLCLTIEGILTELLAKFSNQNEFITAAWNQRLSAFVLAPLFGVAMLSNFYLLCGYRNGNDYFYKLFFESSIKEIFVLWTILYCGCHVGIGVNRYEKQKIV